MEFKKEISYFPFEKPSSILSYTANAGTKLAGAALCGLIGTSVGHMANAIISIDENQLTTTVIGTALGVGYGFLLSGVKTISKDNTTEYKAKIAPIGYMSVIVTENNKQN